MPITVYVWLPHGDNVGHSSMTLSDGTHISWWPGNKDLKNKANIFSMLISPAALSQSLAEDIHSEGDIQPDRTYTLPDGFINEADIRTWWDTLSANGVYRVFDQNCCHVVFRALEAGRAWWHITDEDVRGRGRTLLKPADIDTLVRRLVTSLQQR